MSAAGTTTRKRFWRSPLAMWLLWIMLGIVLLVGFSILSAYPSMIHLVQAGTLGTLGTLAG